MGKEKPKVGRPKGGEQEGLLERVLAEREKNPDATTRQIAKVLNVDYSTVARKLRSKEGQICQKAMHERMIDRLSDIRESALKELEKIIDPKNKRNWSSLVRFQAIKLVLDPILKVAPESSPDELVFETVISETGMIEQTSRKVYYKQTLKDKVDDKQS